MKLTHIRRSVILILLSISLLTLIRSSAFGQSANFGKQTPIVVDAMNQPDSPLIITLVGVNNTAERVQAINFTLQNTNLKKIKNYSILLSYRPNSLRSGLYTFQSAIAPGQVIERSVSEARVNIDEEKTALLSVDYVVFEDGSSWGEDSKKESKFLSSFEEGQKKALSEVKDLINKSDKAALSKLLLREDFETDIPTTGVNTPDNQRIGFSSGYKSVLVALQTIYRNQGIDAVLLKFEEVVSSLKSITSTPR
jgi:hypothetical protein